MLRRRKKLEEEREQVGSLENGLQRTESWNGRKETEQGERDRQTADGKGRWNGKDVGRGGGAGGETPAGVRQTRGAGEDRQKERSPLRRGRWSKGEREAGAGQTDRERVGKSMRRTDRWQGQEGAPGCLHSAVFTS